MVATTPDCDSGDILEIGSIYITSGMCNVFDTEDCQKNTNSQHYGSKIRTKCFNVDRSARKTLGGMECHVKIY
jgi:hypothetical protein